MLDFRTLVKKKKRITGSGSEWRSLPAPPIVASPSSKSSSPLVLVLSALARIRQNVAPARLRNLLIGHNGEASRMNTAISSITFAPPVAHGKQKLTCCRCKWKAELVVQTFPCNNDDAFFLTLTPAVLPACLYAGKEVLTAGRDGMNCHRLDRRHSTIPSKTQQHCF